MGNPDVVHSHPPRCFIEADLIQSDWNAMITVTRLETQVTCPLCVYYRFHPEAKALEAAYREGRVIGPS
jgi:hypothetical protein